MKSARVKEIRECAKRANVQIAAIEQGKKHLKVLLTNGRTVFTSATPSDWRCSMKLVADLRKEWNYGAPT